MPDLRTSAVTQQLDSQYKIETSVKYGADVLIILESRGGTGPSARNPDYSKQLFRILQVLQKSGCIIPCIELRFEPIVGETYFVYQNEKSTNFLSMIAPHECKFLYICSVKLNTEGQWVLIDGTFPKN